MSRLALSALLLVACDGATPPATDAGPEPDVRFTAVTFNTGTAPELAHDGASGTGRVVSSVADEDLRHDLCSQEGDCLTGRRGVRVLYCCNANLANELRLGRSR